MTKTLKPNQLTDQSKPWGMIRFIHFRDNSEHTFHTQVNSMTGNRLTAFDSDPPTIDDPMPWIKSVFRDIRKKATVLEYVGTKHFEKCI